MMKTNLIFNSDGYIKSHAVGEVDKSKDYFFRTKGNRPRAVRGGIYDEMIFGLTGKCKCGLTNIDKCPHCGYTVYDDNEYLSNYAYYQLSNYYVAATKFDAMINKLSQVGINIPLFTKDRLKSLWSTVFYIYDPYVDALTAAIFEDGESTDNSYTIQIDGKDMKLSMVEMDEDSDIELIGANGLAALADYSIDNQPLSFLKDYVNSLLVIISPGLREPSFPLIKGVIHKHFPSIHTNYKFIIGMDKNVRVIDTKVRLGVVDKATIYYMMNLIMDYHFASSALFEKSKSSLWRSSVSTRNPESLRPNIVSHPTAKVNEIYLPRSGCYHALQARIISKLVKDESMDDCDAFMLYEKMDPRAIAAFEEIVRTTPVLVNRPPTLQRNNIMEFTHVKLWDEPCLGLNSLICKAYNADFDGDAMAVHFVVDESLRMQLGNSLKVENLWLFDKNHAPVYMPSNTTIYGLFCATRFNTDESVRTFDKFESIESAYNATEIEVDDKITLMPAKITTYGREKISKILGMDISLIVGDKPLDVSGVSKVIAGLFNNPDRVDIIQNLRDFGNEVATLIGIDIIPVKNLYAGMSDEIDAILNDPELEDIIKINKITKVVPELLSREIKKLPDNNLDLLMEGSRINASTVKSLYTPYIRMDDNGKIKVGDSTIVGGLSEEEYITAVHTQRKILGIKSEALPRGGFNERQLLITALDLRYKDADAPDESYVEVPKEAAVDREVLGDSDIPGMVKIRSSASNVNPTIYRNEINPISTRLFDSGARIGVAYSKALTEFMTQDQLSLKYGGLLEEFTGDDIISHVSGTPSYADGTISIGGYKYILTKGVLPSEAVVKGLHVNVGDVLAINTNLLSVELRLANFISLLDLNVATRKGDKHKYKIKSAFSYAYNSGRVSYVGGKLKIGDVEYGDVIEGFTYFYPEGYEVKYGDHLCSAVLAVGRLVDRIGPEKAFYLFYLELSRIAKMKNLNMDLAEVIFKVFRISGYSISKRLLNNPDFITRQYYGAAKSGFKSAARSASKKAGLDDMKISIDESNPIFKVLMRSSVELASKVDYEVQD